MKHQFMNKTNGKIASVLVMYLDDDGHMQTDGYDKVEDLLKDYGAYVKAKNEPYIGDEATAKFVRDWAKHWGIDELVAHIYEGSLCLVGWTEPRARGRAIDILSAFVSGEVEEGGHYTIDELCGEEEE